ncbi:Hsp20/alpha crystallin family protein [Nocardia sp. alder85J]|uniref:Hsp20/alpha crystallin family protein n=1 Tax=Nocardia sp. alder85J TaxID=2862949 RepID=UPI001CD65205|nr:Hsp20/alpha crystallin family protein [Nocardia sp. alder85J]MCX4095856.1 Hsp20/alpha crystallin family protein [Nocardia sp. alder85J]
MSLFPVHRESTLPDIGDLWSALTSGHFPPTTRGAHLLRVEDAVEDGHYVVRAEIPGIDPAEDVDVSVREHQLTIKAERTEQHEDKGRSEFSYGSFYRAVTLPPGADEEAVEASYAKGILTVSVPLHEPAEQIRKVEVKNAE